MPESIPVPASPSLPSDGGLVRGIGLRALTLTAANATIGASIFVLPALVAKGLGVAALGVYAVCALAIGLVTLCFAEAGSRIASSGGLYTYTEVAFGPFVGYLVGTLFWVGTVTSSGAAGLVLLGSITSYVPVFASPLPRAALLLAIYAFLIAVNIRGLGAGVLLVETLTVLKLLPLILVFVAAGVAFRSTNLVASGGPRRRGQLGGRWAADTCRLCGIRAGACQRRRDP